MSVRIQEFLGGVDRGSLQALINLAAAAVEKLDVVLDEALSRPA